LLFRDFSGFTKGFMLPVLVDLDVSAIINSVIHMEKIGSLSQTPILHVRSTAAHKRLAGEANPTNIHILPKNGRIGLLRILIICCVLNSKDLTITCIQENS